MQNHTDDLELNDLMLRRREELEALRNSGIEPYPYRFDRTDLTADVVWNFRDEAPRRTVAVAGRIMELRRMGKASFCHIQDVSGRLQIYLKKEDLAGTYDAFRLMDIGDIVGVRGFVFRTRTGEGTVHAGGLTLLAKSLRALPPYALEPSAASREGSL